MNNSKTAISALMLMGILVSACSSAVSNTYNALTVTPSGAMETARFTETVTPAQASTLPIKKTSTQTPSFVKSTTAVEDSTPEPEILVIQNDLPGKYLPTIADCQPSDGFYIEENGYSPVPNQEVMFEMGMALGRKYIADTERVNGWEVEYLNSTNNQKPRRIFVEAVMHQRPEGAQKALQQFNPISLDPESGWQYLEGEIPGGENQKMYIRKEHAGTDTEFWYIQIELAYYNYFMKILAEGTPSQMDMNFLKYLLKVSYSRLKEEKLYALQPLPTSTLSYSEALPATIQPQYLALSQDDLPEEAGYRSSKFDDKTLQNNQIIRQWGIDLGRKYVISTDRKFGWDISYSSYERRYWVDQVNQAYDQWWDENFEKWLADNPDYKPFTVPYIYLTKKYPEFIECQVIQYGSSEGARKALTITEERNHPRQNGWRITQGYDTVGEASVIQVNHAVIEYGEVYGGLSLTFVYRNYLITVHLTGYDQTLDPKFAIDLSNIIIGKMKKAQ